MVVQCPYCETQLRIEDTSEVVQCDHCRKAFSLRVRETVTCPGCGADLTVPAGATVVLCGNCRRRVHVRMPPADDPSSDSTPAQDQSSSATDETASFPNDTSVVGSPADFEDARLRTVQAEFADRYEVLAAIGHGGMGAVYKAKQRQPERLVVLKVMLSGRFASEKYRIRFEREAQAIARLKHAGIVSVYEYGEVHGQPYFSMEYVEGCNVREYVIRHHLDKHDICRLMVKIARAVAYAHQRGIIHRDLKPGNILVDGQGNPRLLDFGLARLADDPWLEEGDVTEAGEVMGTPSYMSPEQTLGRVEEIDLRSDVYSMGVLFYELLTGSLPYRIDRNRPLESLRVIRDYVPKRPSGVNGRLDADLDAVVMKCLEKEREMRYQSAVELSEDVGRYLEGKPVEARPSTVFYHLRKLVWRRRTLFLPVSAAFLIGLVLNAVFILELVKSQRRALDQYAQALEGNQEMARFVVNLGAIRSTVDSLIARGQWQEAYDTASFAEKHLADRGYAGYAQIVRQRVAKGAAGEFAKVDELIKNLKFKDARDRIQQLKELAQQVQLPDLANRADHASNQFAADCWQSLSTYIQNGGGSARALERFLAEVPGSEYDDDASRILQRLLHSIRFTEWPFDAKEAVRRQHMTGQVMDLPEHRTVSLDTGASLVLTLVPAGEFVMGSATEQPGTGSDSVPQHRVRITNPFYLGSTEVTCAQFEAVTGRLPLALTGKDAAGCADLPAPVSYEEASDFCKKLSLRSGMTVHLPTEAQWEYACRAGSDGAYGPAAGLKDLTADAWDEADSNGQAHAVRTKQPNAWGLYDMLGNLREWCQDWYDARYYLASPKDDPTGPSSGTYKVLRGGSYMDAPEALQIPMRTASSPDTARPTYGFRVCVDVLDPSVVGRAVASSMKY